MSDYKVLLPDKNLSLGGLQSHLIIPDSNVKPSFSNLYEIDRADPINDGLIGWWPLNEGSGSKSHDISGFSYHGDTVNMENSDWSVMDNGACLDFDGSNEYISLPSEASIAGLSQVTFSVWAYFRDFSDNPGIFVEQTSSGGFTRLGLYAIPIFGWAKLRIYFRDATQDPSGTASIVISTGNIYVNNLYHLVIIFDSINNHHKIFINGRLDKEDNTAASALGTSNTAGFNIGALQATSNRTNGFINDARAWNRALTNDEVARLYSEPYSMLKSTSPYSYSIKVLNDYKVLIPDEATDYKVLLPD